MSSAEDELRMGWSVLSAPTDQEFNAFDLDATTDAGRCRIALDRDSTRHLLIPLVAPRPLAPSEPQILGLSLRKLDFSKEIAWYLDLSCTDGSLSREFDSVILDVISEIAGSSDIQSSAMSCIIRWRRLFQTSRRASWPFERRVGLFAELCLLTRLALREGDAAIAQWRGPHNAVHDFELADRCIEVKGVGATSSSVVIHGINQLSSHDSRPLHLLLVSVEEDPGGATIDELAEEICALMQDPADFQSLMTRTGWPPSRYADRFSASAARVIAVDSTVPALVPDRFAAGRIDDGIESVTYAIDLAVLEPLGFVSDLDGALNVGVA